MLCQWTGVISDFLFLHCLLFSFLFLGLCRKKWTSALFLFSIFQVVFVTGGSVTAFITQSAVYPLYYE